MNNAMQKFWKKPVFLIVLIIIFCVLTSNLVSGSTGENVDPMKYSGLVSHIKEDSGKIESSLYQLQKSSDRSQISALGLDVKEDKVRVVIELTENASQDSLVAIETLGGDIETTSQNLVQAMAPISQLSAIAGLSFVKVVRPPNKPNFDVISEGVGVIKADLANAAGYTGQGVKVAVIDCGFNITSSEISGNIVESKSFRSDGDITGGNCGHGTATAEIVVDVAPNVSLYLYNIETDVEWYKAVDYAVSQGVDIISHSMGFFNMGNYDGTSPIDQKVDYVRQSGILWINSAGNYAERHWEGTFTDTDNNYTHEFTFSPVDEGNDFYATANSPVAIFLSWDDWGATGKDLDLCFLNSMGDTVVCSTNNQTGGYPYPTEKLIGSFSISGWYSVAIYNNADAGDVHIELYSFYNDFEHQVANSSVICPADSNSSLTVGATYWNDDSLEDFSSQGPTNDGRAKPDVTAPDGTSSSIYGSGFFGTSASAPHVAGAAALLLDQNPSLSPSQIQTILEDNAVDLGVAGKDNQTGAGRIDIYASLNLSSGSQIQIDSCTTITSPGMYVLTQDLTNSSTCITIESSNVTFDGADYSITGSSGNNTGIYVYNSSTTLTNVTVRNVTVTGWQYGIYYRSVENGGITNNTANSNSDAGIWLNSSSNNNSLIGNTASNNDWGILLQSSSNNNTIANNTVNSNTLRGIDLWSSSNNTITDNIASNNNNNNSVGILLESSSNYNIITDNTASNNFYGIFFWDSNNYNIITDNTIYNSTDMGIEMWSSNNNTIYNNFFNNTGNIYDNASNYWNTTNSTGPNIIGGPYLGGNLWTKPDGTGFSQTCIDMDDDGICDSYYNLPNLSSGNVDYLPLKYLPIHNLDTSLSYSTIQNAIDAAETKTGHTIQVDAGTYTENVNVNKSLNIIGAGMGITIVNASNPEVTFAAVFNVNASGVNISGFTIKDATGNLSAPCNETGSSGCAAGIVIWSDNAMIYDNNITGNKFGVGSLANYSVIKNNVIENNSFFGVFLVEGNGSVVEGNNVTLSGGFSGIGLENTSDNTIVNNNVSNNNGTGIGLGSPGSNTVTNNTIANNTAEGNSGQGISLSYSDGNVIADNNISYNMEGIWLGNSSNNTISGNNASYNIVYNGISLGDSDNNTIINNIANSNNHTGIVLYLPSHNNQIINNTFLSNNNRSGIHLDNSSNNTIANNNASLNKGGIVLENGSNYNTISNNTVNSNNKSGIRVKIASNYNTIIDNTASNNNLYDFYSTDSANNTVVDLTINPTISFTGEDIAIKSVSTPPLDDINSNISNISKYVNATNVSGSSWLFLNVSYTLSDIVGINVSSLLMWRHNGTNWSNVSGSGVNIADRYVYADITEFNVFAPMGLPDTTPPKIENVSHVSVTKISAVITWDTDEPANSTVYYWTTTSTNSTRQNQSFVTGHSVTLDGLSTGTKYYYNVSSCDMAGNCDTSQQYSFTTPSSGTPGTPSSGGGGGGGGGGAPTSFEAWIKNVLAGETFELDIDDEDIPYIKGLSLTAKQDIYSSKLSITDLDKKPWYGMEEPDAIVNRYFKVSYDKKNYVESASFKVSVNKSWLKQNDIDPSKFSVYRYTNSWEELDTKILKEDGEDIHFEVTTPGFSYFSLGGANGSGYKSIKEEVSLTEKDAIASIQAEKSPVTIPPVETPPPEPKKAPEEEEEKGGICGPTAVVLLAMMVLLFRRRRTLS